MSVPVKPRLSAEQVQQLIREGLPAANSNGVQVEAVGAGLARIRLPYQERFLRPGGIISGPTLFGAADTAMYAAVLAHLGPELMAVTADTNIRFLRAARADDVVAEAQILKLGRSLIVCEVWVWTESRERAAAHVTGSYARPPVSAVDSSTSLS